jgi:hypothetical protein
MVRPDTKNTERRIEGSPIFRRQCLIVAMRVAATALIVVFMSFAMLAAPQAPPAPKPPVAGAGTGAISGVVLDGSTRQPIAGAIVTLAANPRGFANSVVLRIASDASGRFVFTRLPAAPAYYLLAVQFGYFDGGFGRDVPATGEGRPIALGDGEWFSGARIQLWRPASIGGRIVDEAGEPVVGAYVRVLPQVLVAGVTRLAAGPVVATDDRGIYRIGGLAAGKYLVSFPSVQMAAPAATPPLTLANIPANAHAANERAGIPTTVPRLLAVDPANRLDVGAYVAPPQARGGRAQVYPPLFFPHARSVTEAGVIELGFGEDRGGVDLQLRPEAGIRVSGHVVGPAASLAGLTLRLLPRGSEELGVGSETATALVGANGAFTMVNVPPGEYTLVSGRQMMQYHFAPGGSNLDTELPRPPGFLPGQANGTVTSGTPGVGYSASTQAGDNSHFGRMPLSVAEPEVRDVVFELRPGVAIRGRVAWEGNVTAPMVTMAGGAPAGGAPPRPASTPVYAEPADGNAALGMPSGRYDLATQTFEITGLVAGSYRLRIMGGTTIKSITWEGRDLTYEPFDASEGRDFNGVVVTMTDRTATIEGSVRDESGNKATTAAVLAFPTDRRRWTRFGYSPSNLRSVSTSQNGTFTISLAAGEYYVVAVDPARAAGLYDPAVLAVLAPKAETVRVDWGETKAQVITLRPLR